MKLFSIRNLIGIGALYGGWKYAQKHGGVKQAFNGLLDKVKTAAEQRDSSIGAGDSPSQGSEVETGAGSSGAGSYGTSGSYTGGYSGGGGYAGGGGSTGGGSTGGGNRR